MISWGVKGFWFAQEKGGGDGKWVLAWEFVKS